MSLPSFCTWGKWGSKVTNPNHSVSIRSRIRIQTHVTPKPMTFLVQHIIFNIFSPRSKLQSLYYTPLSRKNVEKIQSTDKCFIKVPVMTLSKKVLFYRVGWVTEAVIICLSVKTSKCQNHHSSHQFTVYTPLSSYLSRFNLKKCIAKLGKKVPCCICHSLEIKISILILH